MMNTSQRRLYHKLMMPNFGRMTTVVPIGYILLTGIVPILFVMLQSLTFSDIDGRSFGNISSDGYRLLLRSYRLIQLERVAVRAVLVVVVDILLGVPTSFVLVRMLSSRSRMICLTLFTVPFLLSDITRAFSWRMLLGQHGAINKILLALGVVKEPLSQLLFSNVAVLIALVASTVSFVIFASTLTIGAIPEELWEAAQEFGLNSTHQFFRVALPMSLSAIVAGGACAFFVSVGASAEMAMLGGLDQSTIARLVADLEGARRLNAAFALGTLVFGLVVLIAFVYRLVVARRG